MWRCLRGGNGCRICGKNGKIEIWKNGNRKECALKAQIHIAQGTTLGNGITLLISAPCKGNYIPSQPIMPTNKQ
jgi:hypothetical protein